LSTPSHLSSVPPPPPLLRRPVYRPARDIPRSALPRGGRPSSGPADTWRATADPAAGGAAGWHGWGGGQSRPPDTSPPGPAGSRRRGQPPPPAGHRQRGSGSLRRSAAAPRPRPAHRHRCRDRAAPADAWRPPAAPAAPRDGHRAPTQCDVPSLLLVVRFSTADVIKNAPALVENPSTEWVKIQPLRRGLPPPTHGLLDHKTPSPWGGGGSGLPRQRFRSSNGLAGGRPRRSARRRPTVGRKR